MNIVFVTGSYKPAYIYGGPIKSLSAQAEALVEEGVSVTILTTNSNGNQRLDVPLGEPILVDGVPVYYYPLSRIPFGSFDYSPKLAQACKEKARHADIVVLQAIWSHVAGTVVATCKRYDVPYVIALRGQLLPWSMKQKRVKKWMYMQLFAKNYLNHASALHCTAQIEAETLTHYRLRAPAFVIPNSLNITRFSKPLPPEGGSF